MKIKFKDLYLDNEEIILDVTDIVMMAGNENETIIIENVDGVIYKATIVEFI